MVKKTNNKFLLSVFVSNIIMIGVHNKLFNGLKTYHIKKGFTNLYLAKKFEKQNFTDLIEIKIENQPGPEFKK